MIFTDEEVIKRIQGGEKELFGEIIDRYQKKLAHYVRRLMNLGEEEVEEIVEEALIKAYENIQEFETKRKFSSWIYRLTHNGAIDYWRKYRKKVMLTEETEELIEDEGKLIEDLEIEKEEKLKLHQALGKLEYKFKEVVVLYYFENKSYEEISDILKIPTTNVGVLLFRAKNKLKLIYE